MRRLGHGLREQGGCAGDALGPQGAAGQLWPDASRGQDAVDRVRSICGPLASAARRAATRDLRLPRLPPLLRADSGRQVYREALDGRETPDAQADGVAPGRLAAHARVT